MAGSLEVQELQTRLEHRTQRLYLRPPSAHLQLPLATARACPGLSELSDKAFARAVKVSRLALRRPSVRYRAVCGMAAMHHSPCRSSLCCPSLTKLSVSRLRRTAAYACPGLSDLDEAIASAIEVSRLVLPWPSFGHRAVCGTVTTNSSLDTLIPIRSAFCVCCMKCMYWTLM